MTARLTEKSIKSLAAPGSGSRIHYDTDLPGFGIRLTAAGAKAFVLNYRAAGLERRLTIGRHPTWSVAAAREEATALRRRIDRGEDPLDQRIEARKAPTVRDLWVEVKTKHLPTKSARAAKDDASMWGKIILPALGSRKCAAVTHTDVDDLHADVTRTRPVRANRVVEVLRTAMNLAIRWGWRTSNPCTGSRRNAEDKRTRYLSDAEVGRLVRALEEHPQRSSCDAIKMLLLTGARRSEVLRATWDMFDLGAAIWIKPASLTKQKKLHRVPLSAQAVGLLVAIRDAGRDDVYVFPGRVERAIDGRLAGHQPLNDIKRTWAAVCKEAGLVDTRMHDVRHTFASMTVSQHHGLPVVGALLGHSSASTTQRYAHLYDEPLRDAVNSVGKRIDATSPSARSIQSLQAREQSIDE